MSLNTPQRRDFLKTAGAAFTTSIFTGNMKGANDRLVGAFIGMGRMGLANLSFAQKMDNVTIKSVCDVYAPNLQKRSIIPAEKRVPFAIFGKF